MKKTAFIVSVVFILVSLFSVFSVSAYTPTFEVAANNALLVNVDTEDRVYAKNTDSRISPASTVFMMVALIVAERTDDLNEVVTVNTAATASLSGTGALVSLLKNGEQLTVEQLLHFLLISSYNDVALIFADHISGGADAFVTLMNDKAAILGMEHTRFASPTGLTRSDQYTTVDDMYRLAKAFFANKTLTDILAKARFKVEATNLSKARTLATSNLMSDPTSSYYYKYMVSGKTGNGDEGRCLVSLCEKEGQSYICLVFRCTDKSTRQEFKDTKNLLNWIFDGFEYKTVVNEGDIVPVSAPIELSWDTDSMTLAAGSSVVALLPKDADLSTIEYKPQLSKATFDAPIKSGDVLGTASIVFADESIGTVELVATEDVDGSTVLRIWRFLKSIVTNIFFIIGAIVVAVGFIVLTVMANIKARRRREKKLRLKKRL